MSQHDYNIANQTFPATRTDLNNALGAVATNNSGNSAPSTTYANQWWFDLDDNKLYMRNKDNDAWVSILTIGATSDLQTITTDLISEVTSAAGVTIDSLLIKDGKIANLMNATLNAADLGSGVHIKTADSGGTANANADELILEGAGSGSGVGMGILSATDGFGYIVFGDSGGNAQGGIQYHNNGDSMRFNTNDAERMRIDSSGKVGIGTTSPSSFNSGANKLVVGTGSGNNGLTIFAENNASSSIYFADGTSGDAAYRGYIQFNHSSDAMVIATSATQVASFHTDGIVFNENSNDQNFRIESNDNTHMLFVDAGDNRVGIKSAPDLGGALHIKTGDSGGTVNGNYDTLVIEESGHSGIEILSGTGSTGLIGFGDSGAALRGYIGYSHSTDAMEFGTAGAERMRINSSGNLLVGTTSADPGSSSSNAKVVINTLNNGYAALTCFNTGTGAVNIISLENGNGQVGRIQVSGSATSYLTSSDYRIKENISYDFDATSRLKQLKPARFNFITDTDETVDGFLAHEVSDIVPEAISGEKDKTETKVKVVVSANDVVIEENVEETDWVTGKSDILWTSDDPETQDVLYTSDDIETQDVLYTEEDELPEGVEVGEVKESATKSVGDVKQEATQTVGDVKTEAIYPSDSTWEASKVIPVYQGIDQSKLVPLLVKTIQELEARITALES